LNRRLYSWLVSKVGFAVPEAGTPPRSRLAMTLAAVVFFSLQSPYDAEARRHCGHGQFFRVSLGQCVGARSRAARGFHRTGLSGRHSLRRRHAHRYRLLRARHRIPLPVAVEPDETPDEVMVTPKLQERVERAAKGARLPSAETPETSELPVGITGSVLMRPPISKTFEWLSPSHQHPEGQQP
jgi:hypothetical protein